MMDGWRGDLKPGVRVTLAALVGLSHAILIVLALTNTLSFTVDTWSLLLFRAADSDVWIFLNAAVILTMAFAMRKHQWRATACGFSTGVLSAWGTLHLLWGLTAETPVSLVGPFFVLLMSGVSHTLTLQWAQHEQHDEAGN